MPDLLPENPPMPENGYTVAPTMDMTAGLFNLVFGSIHARLAAREELEADFEALISTGTSAALTMIQENIAPQLLGLQQAVADAQDAVEDLLATGTAPNAAKLGNQLPGYYLDPANFTVSETVKVMLAASGPITAREAIGAVGLTGSQEIVGNKRFRSAGPVGTASGSAAMLEVFASPSTGNAAFMAFHRQGVRAAYFGIDTDNKLKYGGWSHGESAYEIWHAGNFTPGNYLSLAGGAMAGDLRLDGGIGIGMAPPQAGGLYFYRANGNPFIVFLGDANSTGTPVQLAQIRAEQSINRLRLTNSGLSDLVSFNLTTRLGEVAGDPTAPLGIATKQYVDNRTARQVFTSSGTWTKPAGLNPEALVLVEAWGGGAGGGRGNNGGSAGSGGGGGGGGGYNYRVFRAGDLPASVPVTIGAGGAKAPATVERGSPGGDTSFGALLTAFGGGEGNGSSGNNGVGGGGGGQLSAGLGGVAAGGLAGAPTPTGNSAGGAMLQNGEPGLFSGGGGGGGSQTGGTNSGGGGRSLYGGGGGGGGNGGPAGGDGGLSVFGGRGGNSVAGVNGEDGVAPGGAGAGAPRAAGCLAGDGARGECRVRIIG